LGQGAACLWHDGIGKFCTQDLIKFFKFVHRLIGLAKSWNVDFRGTENDDVAFVVWK
jgi:hypothetical protein